MIQPTTSNPKNLLLKIWLQWPTQFVCPDLIPQSFFKIQSDADRFLNCRSGWILHFRTGSGFDWILKNNSIGSDMDIQTALINAVKCLIRGFVRI